MVAAIASLDPDILIRTEFVPRDSRGNFYESLVGLA
jgi:hypothetical protein